VIASEVAQLWTVFGMGLASLNRCAPRSEIWLRPHAALAMSGEPYADSNMAVVDVDGEQEATLVSFVGRLRERGLPAAFNLSCAATPKLTNLALGLGLEEDGVVPLMIRDAGSASRRPQVAPTGETSTRRVTDPADLTAVASVCGPAFDQAIGSVARILDRNVLTLPGLDIFLARSGDVPVSALATTLHGGFLGIWAMATSPSHQRQGHARTALSFALEYHQGRAEYSYLTASDAGRPLYEELGFTTVEESSAWILASGEAQRPVKWCTTLSATGRLKTQSCTACGR
jgi:GNAT superfamily N-acetyltransferase